MPKKKKVKSTNQEEFFDDCPICQAIKEGKTSIADLEEAFEKAKAQGAIVDGPLFDKKSN